VFLLKIYRLFEKNISFFAKKFGEKEKSVIFAARLTKTTQFIDIMREITR